MMFCLCCWCQVNLQLSLQLVHVCQSNNLSYPQFEQHLPGVLHQPYRKRSMVFSPPTNASTPTTYRTPLSVQVWHPIFPHHFHKLQIFLSLSVTLRCNHSFLIYNSLDGLDCPTVAVSDGLDGSNGLDGSPWPRNRAPGAPWKWSPL